MTAPRKLATLHMIRATSQVSESLPLIGFKSTQNPRQFYFVSKLENFEHLRLLRRTAVQSHHEETTYHGWKQSG